MILNVNESIADGKTNVFSTAIKQFRKTTTKPDKYLVEEKAENLKESVKYLFDYAKSQSKIVSTNVAALPELYVAGMDDEQIWQQMELQFQSQTKDVMRNISKLLSKTNNISASKGKNDDDVEAEEDNSEEYSQDDDEDEDEDDNDDGDDDDDDDEDDELEGGHKKSLEPNNPFINKKGRSSIVDDEFFKLSEMEQFLEAEDRKEMMKTNNKQQLPKDDDYDYFKNDDSESDEDDIPNYKYEEFFDIEGRRPGELSFDEKRQQRRAALEIKNKKQNKLKKTDLGLDESDIDEDDVDADDVEELDDDEDEAGEEEEYEDGEGEEEEDKDNENEEDDENDTINDKSKVKFDLSKNSYRSDSENEDDDENRAVKSINNTAAAHDENEEQDEGEKSTFEQRQERLRLRIQDMEEEVLGEKTWQLRGEIDSTSRPQNSLLEEFLEFERTTRPAPIITEATTMQLEDLIRQRVKDKAWNDVERKYKPDPSRQEFRKKLVLDQEKSKESLVQIYEKEYLKELDKLDPTAQDKDDEEPKEHKEIRTMMKNLFGKLDALSNFFYTPKPAAPDVKIITNTPAIDMEEVAPVAVSNAQLLAPEEVKSSNRGDIIGRSERTDTDKKRERRQKKQKQKSIKIAEEKRDIEKQKLGIPLSSKVEKQKLLEKVTKDRNVHKMKESTSASIKSSQKFFSQLQQEVTTNIKNKSKGGGKKRGGVTEGSENNAKRFKL